MSEQELNEYQLGRVLLIDKPLEWTSFQVVNKIRWAIRKEFKLKKIKVGHAGTLDPLATGLLILCTGRKTKEIESYQAQTKEYTGKLMLGATTPSYDMETEIDERYPTDHIAPQALNEIEKKFTGEQLQRPPVFSAVHIDGKRAYDLARKGLRPDVPPRLIEIMQLDLDASNFPEVAFKVTCSKGTYIRSLVRDIGEALDSGAYMTELRRTAIGEISVNDALSIEELVGEIKERSS